jgi:hypothetical protein
VYPSARAASRRTALLVRRARCLAWSTHRRNRFETGRLREMPA